MLYILFEFATLIMFLVIVIIFFSEFYILAGIITLLMCFCIVITFSSVLFGVIGAVLSTVILISVISYIIYFEYVRDHLKLSKTLPEWVVFRKICSHLDLENDFVCYKLLESQDKNLAWEDALYYFEINKQFHENLLQEIELSRRRKEKDKNERISIIKDMFSDHFNDFSKKLTEKMNEEST